MQSKIPWFGVRRGQSFLECDGVCYLQGVLVRLQDYVQCMADDLLGWYTDREAKAKEEKYPNGPYALMHALCLLSRSKAVALRAVKNASRSVLAQVQ